MKVLIVDDQPNVRLLLSRVVRKVGDHDVAEAAHGLEALDYLARHPVDVVILDVLMPLMDGVETLEALRRTPALQHLPVIVLSAVRDEGKVRQLVRLGIAAYLAKPLRPLEVAERLQELLPQLTQRPVPAPRREGAPLPSGTSVLARRRDLRDQMVAATEQVFGMRLGITVVERAGGDPPAVGDDFARVRLDVPLEGGALECGILARRGMSERMTAQHVRAGDLIDDAEVQATLRELVTIISGRLVSTLREQGEQVVAAPADVTRAVQADLPAAEGVHVHFASHAEDLHFLTLLRPVAAAGAALASDRTPAA